MYKFSKKAVVNSLLSFGEFAKKAVLYSFIFFNVCIIVTLLVLGNFVRVFMGMALLGSVMIITKRDLFKRGKTISTECFLFDLMLYLFVSGICLVYLILSLKYPLC